LDTDMIKGIVIDKRYSSKLPVAKWTPPVNGVDGTITYRFETVVKNAPVEDEHGFVDYKNLGLVRTVHKGDVIADITMPTEGEPGMDVRGKTLRQIVGKKAKYTVGTNTAVPEDGLQIISNVDGNVNYRGGAFHVDQVVTIAGDVDASVGNISFVGDVVVKGEVLEGFKISSNANIIVAGNVNGATLEADGDIVIKKGCINSNVVAHGSVTANFCEYSDIKCDGDLNSTNFVVCDVYCGGTITTKGNNGGLLGGKYTCLNSVELSNIGTKSYIPTMLTIGDNALLSEEKEAVQNQIEKVKENLEKVLLIIEFLHNKKKEISPKPLPPDKEEILGTSRRQKVLYNVEINNLNKRIEEINISLANRQYLSVGCKGYIYPAVKIIINHAVFKAESEYE
ncbi:MAG: FapA family protein, partial [Oscillospiraceae bacterium]|nr:FapA family protein [Oscillospiraceae bacterium]